MTYQRIVSTNDSDIPLLASILKLPEIARFISIDENNYWNYVTSNEHVLYFKIYEAEHLVAAIHCEMWDKTLYMDIMVVPQYQRRGIATKVLRDIQSGELPFDFEKIEVSIDENNAASIKLFEKMNFVCVSKEEELLNYVFEKPHGIMPVHTNLR